MVIIQEIPVARINDFWNIQFQYLVDDGMITEDEEKHAEAEIQKLTDKNIEEIDRILQEKEKDIMSI